MNYVAKYSLANDTYLATHASYRHLQNLGLLDAEGCLRRGSKNKKLAFTYEHPIPSNIIASALLKNREDCDAISKILEYTNVATILTKEEDDCLTSSGFRKDMPEGWRMLESNPFMRYYAAQIIEGDPDIVIPVKGAVRR